jgi:hypothetical protein
MYWCRKIVRWYCWHLENVDTEEEERQLVERVRAAIVKHNNRKSENALKDLPGYGLQVRQEHERSRYGILVVKDGRDDPVEDGEPILFDDEAILLNHLSRDPYRTRCLVDQCSELRKVSAWVRGHSNSTWHFKGPFSDYLPPPRAKFLIFKLTLP